MSTDSSGHLPSQNESGLLAASSSGVQSRDAGGRLICALCAPQPKGIRSGQSACSYQGCQAHKSCILRVTRPLVPPEKRRRPPSPTPLPPPKRIALRSDAVATEEEIKSKSTMKTHHWSIHRTSAKQNMPNLSEQWVEFSTSHRGNGKWQNLHGEGRTLEFKDIQLPDQDGLLKRTEELAREVMRDVGLRDVAYRAVDQSIIYARRGRGEQEIHFDGTDRSEAGRCITFLFYCTKGLSAKLPQQCHSIVSPSFLHAPCELTPTVAESAQAARIAHNLTYRSFDMTPGDSLLFYQDVPHAGRAAPTKGRKVVIYFKFKPITQPDEPVDAHGRRYLRLPAISQPTGIANIATAPAADVPRASIARGSHEEHHLVITPEKLASAGLGIRGKSRPEAVVAISLAHILAEMKNGISFASAIDKIAKVEHSSPNTLRKDVDHLLTTGTVRSPDSSHRGKGNPTHPLSPHNLMEYDGGPSLEAELLIHSIAKRVREGHNTTSQQIAGSLSKELGIKVSHRTVQRWLNALGYSWQRKRLLGGMKPEHRDARWRQYVLDYAEALADEDAGTHVIVYVDESFVHQHHTRKWGWLRNGDPTVIADSDGKRLIILHAMTDSGLLAEPDAVPSNWMSEVASTAQVVFEEVYEDGQDTSDYHNTMTGAKFTNWLQNRLLPAFNSIYPGKKMILVMDNAAYHKARDETWVSTNKSQTKDTLADTLINHGVNSITTGKGTKLPSHLFATTACTKADLLAAVKKWLADHPDYNRTIVEKLLADKGHRIVYTPPYSPDLQPIEKLWAFIKQLVAARATADRSITECRDQVEEAFESVTKMQCNDLVKHCHGVIDQWMQTEAAGNLHQCGTLAGVVKYFPIIKLSDQTTTPQADSVVLMDIDTPQSAAAVPAPSTGRCLRTRH